MRKWETRYGFPEPVRDDAGNRIFTGEQVIRLKLIKRLLDGGMRPGQVVPLDEPALRALVEQQQVTHPIASESAAENRIIAWLQSRDPAQIRENLRNALLQRGLRAFVGELMPAMNKSVGDAWERGDIAVRDEHLYSEIMQSLVREAIAPIIQADQAERRPRILLTTPPGEAHTLGLLMLEAIMSIAGAYCISLGAQSPLGEVVSGAADFQADIVALSFSAAYPKKKIAPLLKELRAQLPEHTHLWSGGGGIAGLKPTPRGVTLLDSLADALLALEKYRRRSPAGRAD